MTIISNVLPPLIYFLAIFVHPFVVVLCALHVTLTRLFCKKDVPSIRNEVAVITGGGGGLGRAIASELGQRGCHLAIVDVNLSAAEQVAEQIRKQYNVKTKAYQVDVTDHAAVVKLNADVSTDLGDATLVFNNAGIMLFSDMVKPDWREVQNMINVNLTAHFWMNEVFLPKMKEKRRGYIVAISSVAGLFALLEVPAYSATKFGVKALMRSLRSSLHFDGYDNIHACTVFPYFTLTSPAVIEFITNLKIQNLCPFVVDKDAAKCIVQGMLRNEADIVIPKHFGIMYRMLEVLPSIWRERLKHIVTKGLSKRFVEMQKDIQQVQKH